MIRTFVVIALWMLVVPLAHAETLSCHFKGEDGAAADASFDRAADGSVTGTLNVNGEDVPAVRSCLYQPHGFPNGAGSSSVRCPFRKGPMRIELYPTFGTRPSVMVIQWYGYELAGTMSSTDCK